MKLKISLVYQLTRDTRDTNQIKSKFLKALKVMLGDREIDMTEGFYLYITTKLPNPAYSPEISARSAIIDFTVTRQGLEDQLLGRVIKMEKADLERERVRLAEDVMENKALMVELEDNLLKKLSSVKGSIVDDDELIRVLHTTKSTSLLVGQKLAISAETEVQINASRPEFSPLIGGAPTRPCSHWFLILII